MDHPSASVGCQSFIILIMSSSTFSIISCLLTFKLLQIPHFSITKLYPSLSSGADNISFPAEIVNALSVWAVRCVYFGSY